ncbi:MAG: hypothetical protein WB662_05230 [Methyloceanibacter sp.]
MAMKHIQTTIGETTIHIRYASDPDAAKATEWLEFQVPIEPLTVPAAGGDFPLGDLQLRHLATIRLAALRYVRDAIGEETQRLSSLDRRTA